MKIIKARHLLLSCLEKYSYSFQSVIYHEGPDRERGEIMTTLYAISNSAQTTKVKWSEVMVFKTLKSFSDPASDINTMHYAL